MLKNLQDSNKILLAMADAFKNVELKSAILNLKKDILDLEEKDISLREEIKKYKAKVKE